MDNITLKLNSKLHNQNNIDTNKFNSDKKLKELNIYGRTLIFFTSDNGGANYVELDDINKPFRGWKISFFEGGIRVPFIASWPDELILV